MSLRLVLLVSFLCPCLAHAQDTLIKNFSGADLEQFIKKDLNKDFKNSDYGLDIVDTLYYTYLSKENVVFFFARVKKDRFNKPVTAENVNTWNQVASYSRAFLFKDGDSEMLRIEGSIDVSSGVTRNQLKAFYRNFDKEVTKNIDSRFGGLKKADAPPAKNSGPESVRQGFPVQKAGDDLTRSDSAWEIEWDFAPVGKRTVFRIVSAKFLWKDAKGKSRALIVARNLHLAEAFTQYDDVDGINDKGTCWLDIAKVGLAHVPGNEKYLGPSCVGVGKVLESKDPLTNKKVHLELHYDGLRWMKVYGGYDARRGEKLMLWSAIASGNYVYLMEYNFTDDGRILCRLGFTAHNYFDRQAGIAKSKYGSRLNEQDVHPHIGCWRFDPDLSEPASGRGGPERNQVWLVSRVFDPVAKKFRQQKLPFPGDEQAVKSGAAHEGKAKWVPKQFTTLRVESLDVKNSRGLPVAYDLMTTRTGSAEDLMPISQAKGANMDFVNYDFFATLTPQQFKHYYEIPEVAAARRTLFGRPTTIWHSVPALHVPRDEDFGAGGVDSARGAALTEWIGFTLRPRNLFDGTPLFGASE
jgi:hypothetical protein